MLQFRLDPNRRRSTRLMSDKKVAMPPARFTRAGRTIALSFRSFRSFLLTEDERESNWAKKSQRKPPFGRADFIKRPPKSEDKAAGRRRNVVDGNEPQVCADFRSAESARRLSNFGHQRDCRALPPSRLVPPSNRRFDPIDSQ